MRFTIFLLFLFLFSCKNESPSSLGTPKTSKGIANQLVSTLKAKDETALWNHFINQDDLTEYLALMMPAGQDVEAQAASMWGAMNEDKGNQLRVFDDSGIADWSTVQVDSSRISLKSMAQMPNKVPENSTVEGIGALHVYLSQAGKAQHMTIPCMKLKSGAVKLAGYPKFD